MRRKKKCRHCGKNFRPAKFNPCSQHYCSDPECRHASSIASRTKYRKKQSMKLEYRIKESKRVQEDHSKHPGYWKKRKINAKKVSKCSLLRDIAQVEKLQEDVSVLRDIAIRQDIILKGFTSYITGEVLQDVIAIACNRFYDRGKEVSGTVPETDFMSKIKKIGLHNETKSIDRRQAQA